MLKFVNVQKYTDYQTGFKSMTINLLVSTKLCIHYNLLKKTLLFPNKELTNESLFNAACTHYAWDAVYTPDANKSI